MGQILGRRRSLAPKAQDKQLTDYTDGIANGNLGTPQPNEPTWALPADPPVAVPPGIKRRFREIAGEIKAQKSIYTQADGELLGIVAPDEAGLSPETTVPDVKLRSITNYGLEAEFRKYGLDALRVEFRHKGGNWQLSRDSYEQSGRVQHRPDKPPEKPNKSKSARSLSKKTKTSATIRRSTRRLFSREVLEIEKGWEDLFLILLFSNTL